MTESTRQKRSGNTDYVLARELEHLATKEDLGNIRAEIAGVKTEISNLEVRLIKDVNSKIKEVNDNIQSLKDKELKEINDKLNKRDTNKIILSVAGLIIAIGTVLNLFGIHFNK